jgi:hypothetical protein
MNEMQMQIHIAQISMVIKKHQSDRLCHPGSPSFRSHTSGCTKIETFVLNFAPVSFIREYLYRLGLLEDTTVRNP